MTGLGEEGAREQDGRLQHILIDHVLPDRGAIQRAQDITRGLLAHAVHSLPCHAGDMRGDDHIGQLKQRIWNRRRLLRKHIKAGAGQFA